MGRRQHRFHGDPQRFHVLAAYIFARYGNDVRYIADVAGGQGMLTRVLRKRYNYDCEVIDPRGWVMKGVANREEAYDPSMADFYDLIVGLHADEATRAVAESARIRPTILVPCCNFWSDETLGQTELLEAIETYYRDEGIVYERVRFDFRPPKNIGLVTSPPV